MGEVFEMSLAGPNPPEPMVTVEPLPRPEMLALMVDRALRLPKGHPARERALDFEQRILTILRSPVQLEEMSKQDPRQLVLEAHTPSYLRQSRFNSKRTERGSEYNDIT